MMQYDNGHWQYDNAEKLSTHFFTVLMSPNLCPTSTHILTFLKITSCATSEDLVALKVQQGDYIANCGVPSIYSAKFEDLPQVAEQLVAHHIYLR